MFVLKQYFRVEEFQEALNTVVLFIYLSYPEEKGKEEEDERHHINQNNEPCYYRFFCLQVLVDIFCDHVNCLVHFRHI